MARRKKMASGAAVVLLVIFGFALAGGTPEPVLPQCSDGIDNDGDGYADFEDGECLLQLEYTLYCPNWDNETDPIPFSVTNEEIASMGCYEI